MQQNTQFLLALAKGVWSIEAGLANELAPLADRVLAGEGLELLQAHYKPTEPGALKFNVATAGPAIGSGPRPFRMGWYTDLDKVEPGSIAVIGLNGIVLKYGMCGVGSMERAERVLEAANHPNVAGIVFDIDTPGGQVAGLSTLYDAIIYARQLKPVLAVINDGSCYSAGYNTASACTEIWATHATCGVGSIGTMCQFTDTTEADKKAGLKRVAIYATASTDKNADYRKALAGDTSGIVRELDVMNEDFQGKILKTRRAKIKDPKAVFTGKTFSAAQGVQLGLIDTIGTMQLALARVAELAKVPAPALPADEAEDDERELDDDEDDATATEPPKTPNSIHTMKHFPLFAAAMGVAAKDFVTTAEGAHVQLVAIEAVEALLLAGASATSTLATVQGQLATANTNLTTVQGQLTTAQAEATDKGNKVTELEQQLANVPAGTKPAKEPAKEAAQGSEEKPELTEWEQLDAAVLAELK